MDCLLTTDFKGLKLGKRGKVRDVYELDDSLLIVSTDRISCFDVVLPTAIPYKGLVLNQISKFWFDFTNSLIDNHLITTDVNRYPDSLREYSSFIDGRSMLVKKAKPLTIECIVRGYLSGSAWKEYKNSGCICGHKLPSGLEESQKLPQTIFTPSTKSDIGHDINISEEEAKKVVSSRIFNEVKSKSIAIYEKAHNYGLSCGIIIADTKFEFGLIDEKIILIDEVLTPDSSRFWPLSSYVVGKSQFSFDKQFVRDYLENIGWDKNPPAPELPKEVVERTSQKYLQAYKMLTGGELATFA